MAVGLGLLAALLWGLSDFLASVAGRSYGVHRSLLHTQSLGAVGIGAWILLFAVPFPSQASSVAWIAAVVSAPIGVGATLSLYQGLKHGKVSVVTPITATFGAITAILSLASGEQVHLLTLIGIILVVAGALLVGARRAEGEAKVASNGAIWGVLAATAYGVQFWIQGRFAVPELGGVWPVWIYYLISASLMLLAIPILRGPVRLPPSGLGVVLTTGVVAVGGFLAVAIGLTTGQVALVTVLSSLQSAITVFLACIYHRERLAWPQWLGLVLTLAGLAAVHAG